MTSKALKAKNQLAGQRTTGNASVSEKLPFPLGFAYCYRVGVDHPSSPSATQPPGLEDVALDLSVKGLQQQDLPSA